MIDVEDHSIYSVNDREKKCPQKCLTFWGQYNYRDFYESIIEQ